LSKRESGKENTMIKIGPAFLLLVTVSAFGSAGSSIAAEATDVASLHAADEAWVKAYNSGDVGGVVALYDEHAVLLPPGAPAASGRAAIHAFFTKDMAESSKAGIRFSLGAHPAGGISGDMGWSSGTYTVTDKAGKVLEIGKFLSVSRKVNGQWLYLRDMWNADGPSPMPEAAAPKK
jgi:ketosteroid isomerase-like protein